MAEGRHGAAIAMAELAAAVQAATPLDIVELDQGGADWRILLVDGNWMLNGAPGRIEFAGPSGARMRLVRRGLTYLLVGGNGYPSVQAALEVAWGGETILVAPGDYRDARPFIVNRPVSLHGVSENGTLIVRSDEVVATIHAQQRLEGGAGFMVAAPDVILCGLCFASAATAKVLDVCGERLNLLACIVRSTGPVPAASALHIGGDFQQRGPGAFAWGNVLRGSVTLDVGDGSVPASVTIIGNSIEADLLPALWIRCGAALLQRPAADSALPTIEDNLLPASGAAGISLAVQWDAPAGQAATTPHVLDAWFSRTVRANPGIGAVIVDAFGHMRVTRMPDFAGTGCVEGFAIYAPMPAAMAQAGDGDTLYTGVGIAREQLAAQEAPAWNAAAAQGPAPAEPVQQAVAEDRQELSPTGELRILDSGAERAPVRLFDGMGRLRRTCPSLQAAVEVAVDGDRIVVPMGRHVGDVYIGRAVSISGANIGRPAVSPRRTAEATIMGRIVVGRTATGVIIDGLAIVGSVAMERVLPGNRQLVLRNCVIDGRDTDTAITAASGFGSTIANNLILGGSDEAILIPCGFDGLVISGNHIHATAGAVGIALSGGPGPDCLEILGNTFLGGDYGVLMEVDGALGQPGDAVVLTGNHFGERIAGMVSGAPAVAAVHADGPVPAVLESSLGASLEMNTYHVLAPALGVDVIFESPGRRPFARSRAWSGSRPWPASTAK